MVVVVFKTEEEFIEALGMTREEIMKDVFLHPTDVCLGDHYTRVARETWMTEEVVVLVE